MKILIIEDNKQLAATIQHNLKKYYVADTAHTGKIAEDLAYTNEYDLILLDLGLPDMDGTEVCARIRENGSVVPILAITGKAKLGDKVRTLDSGVDDYLTKPFQFAELLARMRSLLRRNTNTPIISSQLVCSDLTLNTVSQVVQRKGQIIELREKEFQLLEYLMRNQGAAMSRNQILEHVWDTSTDPLTNTVDVHINALRQKICYPFNTRLIKTVHGTGYILKEYKRKEVIPHEKINEKNSYR